MENETKGEPGQDARVAALQNELVAMANLVESAFADSIVALMEGDKELAGKLRTEDYKVHEAWLRVDRLCEELLCAGSLDPHHARFAVTAVKVALDMKRMADEALSIAREAGHVLAEVAGQSGFWRCIPRMVELTQTVLGDALEAFVDHDPQQARALRLVDREIYSLDREAFEELTGDVESGRVPARRASALILVARALERVGDHAFDVANHVARLYGNTQGPAT